jgi:hypothetical protein
VRRALLVLGLFAASRAHAAAGESAVSVSAGLGGFNVTQDNQDISGLGGVVGLDVTYGVADALWLRAAVGGGLYSADGQRTAGGSGSLGVYYAVDVLRYVPYVVAGVGAFVAGGGAVDAKARLTLEIGVGVEVQESRALSWGIEARLASFASQATVFTVGPRISFKFGYF